MKAQRQGEMIQDTRSAGCILLNGYALTRRTK